MTDNVIKKKSRQLLKERMGFESKKERKGNKRNDGRVRIRGPLKPEMVDGNNVLDIIIPPPC